MDSQDLASSISPKLTEGVPDQLINSLDTNELHSSCTLIRQQTEQVMQLQPGQIITKVCVPYQVVGLVVGPRGTTIKRIQQNTNTYIITPSRDSQPVFAIQGLPDNVAQAKIEIENYIQLRTNTSSGQGHLLNGYNSCSSSSSTSSSGPFYCAARCLFFLSRFLAFLTCFLFNRILSCLSYNSTNFVLSTS